MSESEEKLNDILKTFSEEDLLNELSKRHHIVIDCHDQNISFNEEDLTLSKQEIRDENKFYKVLIKRNEKIVKLIEQIRQSLDGADELPE